MFRGNVELRATRKPNVSMCTSPTNVTLVHRRYVPARVRRRAKMIFEEYVRVPGRARLGAQLYDDT